MKSTAELRDTRRFLHQNPELSGLEFKTKDFIQSYFQKNCPSAEIIPLAETGFVAHFKGRNDLPTVMLRCELDALPIQEVNDFEHRSKIPGVSHKCGHDGHQTILLAVATELEENTPDGSVYLLFQPAEEIGTGAEMIASSEKFKQLQPINYAFALHNLPGEELHSIHIRDKEITPAVISSSVSLKGKTSHAAEPQKGKNPASFISELLQWANFHSQTNSKEEGFQVITPIFIEMGSKDFGVSAGAGELGFTLRTGSNEDMDQLKANFSDQLSSLSKKYQIPHDLNWFESFRAVQNDNEAANFIRKAAKNTDFKLHELESPFPWGEDFGIFTEKIPGALFGLGAGKECPALHNPDYDFPDELIESGSKMFLNIISQIQA